MNCPLKHFEACEEKMCAWYDDTEEECAIFAISTQLYDINHTLFNKNP